MSGEERLLLIRDELDMIRAGVVITRRDWKKMSLRERAARIAAVELAMSSRPEPAKAAPVEIKKGDRDLRSLRDRALSMAGGR